MDDLLTSEEVAALLKSSTRFVRRLVAERRIAYVKVGRSVRFEPSAVTAYVESNRVVPIASRRSRYQAVA